MVVVEFDYNEFKEFFGEEKEKTMEILNKIGAPVEVDSETGKVFAEITPNRPDWYSVLGLARAVQAYKTGKAKKYEVEKTNLQIIVDKKVSKIRPYTVGAVVKGLKLSERDVRDIVLLQEKLISTLGRWVKKFGLGVYPAEKIAFPLYYTTLPPKKIVYKPLNYPKEADAEEILREHPKGQAYGHIIKEHKEWPVYLDANKKIMALIPVVNSEETGKIDASTKDIFVEVTGIDLNSINQALNIIVCHLADLGGKIYSVDVVYPNKKIITTPNLDYQEVKITPAKIKKVLGVEIKENEIKECLAKMGYLVEQNKVYIQPYRADIIGEIDIIEDVAIAYGYENFEPTIPDFFSVGKKDRKREELSSIMQRMGFVEVVTPILTDEEKLSEFGFKGIKILNPKTKEYTTIRSTLIPSMIEVLNKNKMAGLPQKFYEIGKVIENDKEKEMLCLAVVGNYEFAEVRGYLQTLFKEYGKEFKLNKKEYDFLDPNYSSQIIVDEQSIGFGGRLKDEIKNKFGFAGDVYIYVIEV